MLNNAQELLHFFNNKGEFTAAVEYTAGQHAFSTNLIEKDYLCSLVLIYLYQQESPLIFKGGTLLAKAHADFYRLSEDLDFTIPIPYNATRRERSRAIKEVKSFLNNICEELPIFTITKPLTGSNESRQYNMELGYQSALNSSKGKILVEIGLRSELSRPPTQTNAKTLLKDPFLNSNKVADFQIRCLTVKEAYAEKIRAALTRRKLAIRDFFDLDHALKDNIIDFNNDELTDLVRIKLSNEALSPSLIDKNELLKLHKKIDTELTPTLASNKANQFDLNKIIKNLLDTYKGNFL